MYERNEASCITFRKSDVRSHANSVYAEALHVRGSLGDASSPVFVYRPRQ
jgi:hypothetical protein